MSTTTPRDADGAKLCAWCGSEIKQSGVGRSRDYCRRSCRQRAYEARRQREAIVSAVASAVARRDTSRDEMQQPSIPSRDETRAAGQSTVPPAPALPDPRLQLARPPVPLPSGPSQRQRRRLLPPPPGAGRDPETP